jgi:ABC-2 type transport system permease protein
MLASLRIAGKDLRERGRDRSAFLVALVLPLALAFIYGSLFGPAATPRALQFAVVDLDGSAIAHAFVADVLEPMARQDILRVRSAATVDEASRLADAGTIDAAFVLPAGFGAAAQGMAATDILVIGNIDAPTGTDVARSIASAYVTQLNSIRTAVAAAAEDASGMPPEQLALLAERARSTAAPVLLQNVSASAKVLDLKAYFAAGMAIFFLFFTVQFGVSSLLDERANGTLSRLLAAPIRPAAVLAGKLLASLLLGLVSMAALMTATALIMGIAWGDPVGVGLVVLGGVLAATGVTALVASLARTMEQAGGWNAIVAVTLALLGGSMFPISQLGGVVATVGLATPHAWFMRGLGELAAGGGPADVLPAVAAMSAFGAMFGALALLRLRKLVQP